MLEQNPPERMFKMYIKIFFQEDFALKLWLNLFSLHRPIFAGLFIFYVPSQYLSSFSSWRPNSKKNPFLANLRVLSACCRLNFDATDLPHTLFELLYPKVFRVTPKVDLESIACLPGPLKVRWCRILSPVVRVFFLSKSIFPAKCSTFAYSMLYMFGKLMHQQ